MNNPEGAMSQVPCSNCGRKYAAELFTNGQTRHCTCGARIGDLPIERCCTRDGRPLFMVDAMLGKLARWLRLLGYDTAYEEHIPDAVLIARALEEARVILTRDRRLPREWRVTQVMLVEATEPFEQLREVGERFELGKKIRLFSRCSSCNAELVSVSRSQARRHVPETIANEQERFQRCPNCDRIYWAGSHTRRIRARIAEIFGDERPAPILTPQADRAPPLRPDAGDHPASAPVSRPKPPSSA